MKANFIDYFNRQTDKEIYTKQTTERLYDYCGIMSKEKEIFEKIYLEIISNIWFLRYKKNLIKEIIKEQNFAQFIE